MFLPEKKSLKGAIAGCVLFALTSLAATYDPVRYAPRTHTFLTLQTPDGAGPFPVVIAAHGGNWTAGSRADAAPFCRTVVELGAACASIDYGLAPANRMPAQIRDIETAVGFLNAHAARYKLDPHAVFLAGESAGGFLVAFIAARHEMKTPPRGVIIFSAPSDLAALGEPGRALGIVAPGVQDLLGVRGWTSSDIERMRQASPLIALRKGTPSLLIIHGSNDELVPLTQAETFCAAVRRNGDQCSLTAIPGARHGLWSEENFDRWEPRWRTVLNNWMNAIKTGTGRNDPR